MRFLVVRENHYEGTSPCKGAFRGPYVHHDRRSTDDPAKIPVSRGDGTWWYQRGQNHRVENGQIVRDEDRVAWFVDIDDLATLLDYADWYGPVTIGIHDYNPSIRQLTF